jgi:hypothetical protein
MEVRYGGARHLIKICGNSEREEVDQTSPRLAVLL